MLVNDVTQRWINGYVARPQTSLLIDSNQDMDSGNSIATHIHTKLMHGSRMPIISVKRAEKAATISIDQVRALQKTLSLSADKDPSRSITRMAVIYDAHTLTTEAQNALLKIMEESPAQTVICLVAASADVLLRTIRSRCFTIPVLPVTEEQALSHAKEINITSEDSKRAYALSEGRAGQFIELINNPDAANESIDSAKQFLQGTTFQKVQFVMDDQFKSKDAVEPFLQSLELVAKTGMRRGAGMQAKQRWMDILSSVLAAKEARKRNANDKLTLLHLALRV